MQKQRRTVERSCVACRIKGGQGEFLRYVLGPGKQVVADYRNRLPGRGAYTCFDRDCIVKALQGGGFSRAFRQEIAHADPSDFFACVVEAISQRILGLLGIARKAGEVVTGTSQLLSAFGRQEIKFLLIAEDASKGAIEKMVRQAEQEGIDWARFSNQEVLGQVSGRENRNCIGIKDKQFADLLALEVNRLQQIAGEN